MAHLGYGLVEVQRQLPDESMLERTNVQVVICSQKHQHMGGKAKGQSPCPLWVFI